MSEIIIMIYKLPKENIETLKKLPETGMGYQKIVAAYERETYLIWNGQISVEQKGYNLNDLITIKNKIKNKTVNDIIALATPKHLTHILLASPDETLVVRDRSLKSEGAIYNKSENTNGDELFVRLSAFKDDVRVDKINKCLLPGTFTTTASDALKCKVERDDPVQRYALPNELLVEWVFYIQPNNTDILQRGNVNADFGKKGGVREVYFEKGTSKTYLYDPK